MFFTGTTDNTRQHAHAHTHTHTHAHTYNTCHATHAHKPQQLKKNKLVVSRPTINVVTNKISNQTQNTSIIVIPLYIRVNSGVSNGAYRQMHFYSLLHKRMFNFSVEQ